MKSKTNRVLPGLLIAMALAASALVLTIPALFSSPEPYQVWLAAILGGLAVLLGIALVLLRRRGTRAISAPHS